MIAYRTIELPEELLIQSITKIKSTKITIQSANEVTYTSFGNGADQIIARFDPDKPQYLHLQSDTNRGSETKPLSDMNTALELFLYMSDYQTYCL
jgi:hypothetical protein